MFPLSHDGAAGEQDCQEGHVVRDMATTPVNQQVVRLGLYATRSSSPARGFSPGTQEGGHLVREDLLNVGGADAGLHHRRGVNVHLHHGMTAGEEVGLEFGWDVSSTKVSRPLSIWASTSLCVISSGFRKKGGRKASAKRLDSADRSSLTMAMAMEVLCNSCEMPVAWE